MMNFILFLIVFIFGTAIGSFLNCIVCRLEKKQNFLFGCSICPICGHKLGFFDLIPVLSFIFLKRKCRYCQKPISLQYPLVELATGILFVLIFWILDFGIYLTFDIWILEFIYYLIIACFLIIIFVYDLKYYLIPGKIIYPAIIIAGIFPACWQAGIFNHFPILSAFAAAAFFLLIVLISREKWMGFGDVELAFFMGLFLGFPNILLALFLSFLIGAIIGLGLMVFKKKGLKSEVPFAPFLIIGTFIALFWGQEIIKWYVLKLL